MKLLTALCLAALTVKVGRAKPATTSAMVAAELAALRKKVPGFAVVKLPRKPGRMVLKPDQSLTVEQLRGVELDPRPPMLQKPAEPYDPRMTDDYPPGGAPYVAQGIGPFRFRYFHCEFNYGGWHNYAMTDYAAAHGFDILYPYSRKPAEGRHLPAGTRWLSWSGFIDWHKWLPAHGIPDGRYDRLAGMDLVALHLKAGLFERPVKPARLSECGDCLMIDMEHGVLPPEKLRRQPWYPGNGAPKDRRAFEKRYYDGYAQTYVSAVEAARRQGWKNISVYGWAPFGRTWGGLEQPIPPPGADFAWNAFGKQIYDAVDLINNSVYCFYWSPKNVAYVLANIDANMARVNAMPVKKPVRPYFWTLLHGGGGGWRWWRGQPIAGEEERAMIALAFFTGIDGLDTWNWSGTGNHHVPPPLISPRKPKDSLSAGADVMLKDGFALAPESRPEAQGRHVFRRHDVVHVLRVDEQREQVWFQWIQPGKKNNGVGAGFPVYVLPVAELTAHLRVKSEPVAAMIEGMALVKPFEYLLRHGQVRIDVPGRVQWKKTLPIVRRVKLGGVHLVATYDPAVVYGGRPRNIVLNDFDGRPGLTLTLPADSQVRLFVLED